MQGNHVVCRIVRYWVPLFVYLGAIVWVSHQSDPTGGRALPLNDKVLHLIEYIPVGFLFVRALCMNMRKACWRDLLYAVVFGVCFAIGDEVHQFFIPERITSLSDLTADQVGVVFGASLRIWCSQRGFFREVS